MFTSKKIGILTTMIMALQMMVSSAQAITLPELVIYGRPDFWAMYSTTFFTRPSGLGQPTTPIGDGAVAGGSYTPTNGLSELPPITIELIENDEENPGLAIAWIVRFARLGAMTASVRNLLQSSPSTSRIFSLFQNANLTRFREMILGTADLAKQISQDLMLYGSNLSRTYTFGSVASEIHVVIEMVGENPIFARLRIGPITTSSSEATTFIQYLLRYIDYF